MNQFSCTVRSPFVAPSFFPCFFFLCSPRFSIQIGPTLSRTPIYTCTYTTSTCMCNARGAYTILLVQLNDTEATPKLRAFIILEKKNLCCYCTHDWGMTRLKARRAPVLGKRGYTRVERCYDSGLMSAPKQSTWYHLREVVVRGSKGTIAVMIMTFGTDGLFRAALASTSAVDPSLRLRVVFLSLCFSSVDSRALLLV